MSLNIMECRMLGSQASSRACQHGLTVQFEKGMGCRLVG